MEDKATVLAELVREMARHDADLPLATRLCRSIGSILGASGVSITLAYTSPERATLCVTDDVAARLDDLQEVLAQGPSHTAYTTGNPVHVVLEHDPASPWPELAAALHEAFGVLEVHAFPIGPYDEVLGVLTCHHSVGQSLRLDDSHAQFLADAVGVALLRDPESVLDEAGPWSSRSTIHQATGMVMAQLRVPSDDALALLKARAFALGESLAATSAAVVRRDVDFRSPDEAEGEGSP
jgi:GAF domain